MHLTAVRDLLEHEGPFTTLHVEVGRPTEDAIAQLDARWTTIRHDLKHAGLDPALVESVGERLREQTHLPGEVRRTLVLDASGIAFDDLQPGHTRWPEITDHGVLPDLRPWVWGAARQLPFALVVADRTGADLELHRAASAPAEEGSTVRGADFYITKVAEGDWAQKQFQQTAEDTWRDNARLVVEEIRSMIRRHTLRAVFVAGEERARSEVVRAWEDVGHEQGADLIALDAGGRAAGASWEAMWDELRAELGELEGYADAQVAERLDEARGRGEGAANGIEEVLDALAKAQAELVAVDLDALREHEVRPADHPGLPLPAAALDADAVPADRVVLAAAALTDAEVVPLPAALTHGGGVAALLRWTDDSAGSADSDAS